MLRVRFVKSVWHTVNMKSVLTINNSNPHSTTMDIIIMSDRQNLRKEVAFSSVYPRDGRAMMQSHINSPDSYSTHLHTDFKINFNI